MEILCRLLPDSTSLQLESWLVDEAIPQITLIVSSTKAVAQCPICTHSTHRIHSHYERTLADLPWANYSIPEQLDPWLKQAIHCGISPFQRFAQRLREDYDAVKAGVTLPVSNDPVEGHINRLKMLKRQMYGRAGIALLSRRFLQAT